MEENDNKKVELSEESEKRIAEAVSKKMKKFSFKSLGIKDIITIVLIVFVAIGGFAIYNGINNNINSIKNGLSQFVSFDNGADSHDLVVSNNGIFGYTAADFEEAILGDSSQEKKIEVYSQDVSDATTLTDTGFLNWSIFTKTQVITYQGHVTYTVDMTNVSSSNIVVNSDEKIITLKIPHAEQGEINIPESEIQFADPERGILAFGDMNISVENTYKIQAEARTKMEEKLKEDNVLEVADRFAKLTVWEIYSPIIKGVSKDYSLEIEFID